MRHTENLAISEVEITEKNILCHACGKKSAVKKMGIFIVYNRSNFELEHKKGSFFYPVCNFKKCREKVTAALEEKRISFLFDDFDNQSLIRQFKGIADILQREIEDEVIGRWAKRKIRLDQQKKEDIKAELLRRNIKIPKIPRRPKKVNASID